MQKACVRIGFVHILTSKAMTRTPKKKGTVPELKSSDKCESREQDFHSCPYCSKSFPWKSYLLAHIRTHTGEKPYKCSHCGNSFSAAGNLKTHIRIHTGEKPFACSVCNKAFAESSGRRKHLRTHTHEKPYNCLCCKQSFSTNQSLKRHMLTHAPLAEMGIDN